MPKRVVLAKKSTFTTMKSCVDDIPKQKGAAAMTQKIKNILLRFHRQRPLLLSLTILVSAIMVLGSTFSWFTQSDNRTNILKTQDILFQFELQEKFDPPQGGVNPGQKVPKIVHVANTGDVPGFVRVLVLAEIISEKGEILEAVPGVTFTYDGMNVTDWTPGNDKMWADGGDGYYYYLGKLNPDQTTLQPLFTSVTLASDLGPEYVGATMKIEVKIEASDTIRANYRNGWWRNGDIPPTDLNLIPIDNTLQGLAI